MRVRFDFSAKRTGKQRKPNTTNKHAVPFPEMVKEVIRTSDVILEVLDVRNIEKTRNKELERSIKEQGKKIIYILNKVDLVDLKKLKMNTELNEIEPYVFFSTKARIGKARLKEKIKIEIKKMKLGSMKGRVGVIGYPNTGKSTLINALAGKSVGTSSQAGFTKATHKIRFNKDIIILDTPGVIPIGEYEEKNERDIKKHVQIGVKTADQLKEADMIVDHLMKKHPGVFEKYYNIESDGDSERLLEELGKKKNFLKKKGEIDVERAAKIIVKDIQEGKLKID